MARKVEIVFDEKEGKFVVHFAGVPTHEEEHEILDQLLSKLKALGFEPEVNHYHDNPKLPEFNNEKTLKQRLKI